MNLTANHHEVMELCRQMADIPLQDPAARWIQFHQLSLKLYAQLARSPFIIDAVAVAAFGTSNAASDAPPPLHQMEWEKFSDKFARSCADVLRAIAFTPSDIIAIREATDRPLSHLSAAAKQLTAAGIAYADDAGRLHISPLGVQTAKYFEENPAAIRPPSSAREANRRRQYA